MGKGWIRVRECVYVVLCACGSEKVRVCVCMLMYAHEKKYVASPTQRWSPYITNRHSYNYLVRLLVGENVKVLHNVWVPNVLRARVCAH